LVHRQARMIGVDVGKGVLWLANVRIMKHENK